jgi:uncharacterized protein
VVMACNQSTNREPVMAVAEFTIEAILSELKTAGWVRFVHPTSGRGVTKYKQVLDEKLDLEGDEAAVLCLLMLRGPQTSNELRARAERLHGFTSTAEVEQTLARLAALAEPFVALMERQPGQKEPRWRQLIADEEIPDPGSGVGGASGAGSSSSTRAIVDAMATRVDELEERVARLEAALVELL